MKYFSAMEICGKTHDNIPIALVGETSANILILVDNTRRYQLDGIQF